MLVGRRNWKERHFKLTSFLPAVKIDKVLPHPYATLQYFDENDRHIGTVILDRYSTIEEFVEKSSKYDFCFGIRRSANAVDLYGKELQKYAVEGHIRDSIDLRATSKDEQLEWEKAFKKVVASCLLIEDLRTTDLKHSKQIEEDSSDNKLRSTKVDDGPSPELKRRFSIGLKRGLSAFFDRKNMQRSRPKPMMRPCES